MVVIFRIRFHTQPGQSLWLMGNSPLPAHPVPLQYLDGEHWQTILTLTDEAATATLNYSYILAREDGSRSTDWGRDRQIIPARYGCEELLVLDSWNHAGFVENVFYTEPFKAVFLATNFTALPA